ncbi:RNA-binding protein [Fulvitalea axinellae]|uniref:RNA-binding protein n=1 Tax=Fulvitalea axinellae TaxID=1182444 RepID=A0AAU9CPN2_9BACT|nr:RNA-binding protein [Fulvitalea axinellae]
MNIYVGNLHYTLTQDDLREVFEQYGIVNSVRLVIDKDSGRSKGYGFVEMQSEFAADLAVERLNEMVLRGRNMVVGKAKNAFFKVSEKPKTRTR